MTLRDAIFMDLGIVIPKPGRRRQKRRGGRWVQKALKVKRRRVRHHLRVQAAHKGALHRRLGIPSGKKITMARLRSALAEAQYEMRHAETKREMRAALKFLQRVRFAMTTRTFKMRH